MAGRWNSTCQEPHVARVGTEKKQPERPGEGWGGNPWPRGSREDAEMRAGSGLDPTGPTWAVCPQEVPRPLSPVP